VRGNVAEDDWCSVSEAARRLGVTPTAIRNRIKRGTLEHRPNGNQGKLVRVPRTVSLTVPEPVPLTVAPTVSEPLRGTVPPAADGTIEALQAHVQTMRDLLDQQAATHAAEVARLIEGATRLQDELQEARAEADHAKADQVRMARDVSTMFDELKALADRHAELHSDRARLQAESEQRTRELERLRDDQAAERARLLDQLVQARSEVENERAHSRSLTEQFERVHRNHRTDTEHERRPWWRRLWGS
jgi:hypothetical protein